MGRSVARTRLCLFCILLGEPVKLRGIAERRVPTGLERDPTPSDGACLYCAFSRGPRAVQLTRDELPVARVRAELVSHMRRHGASYEPFWDGTNGRGVVLTDWAAYLDHMSLPHSWGGQQELAAAARHWHV